MLQHLNKPRIFLKNATKVHIKLKKVRLQTLRRQFKLLQMDNKETINNYFTEVFTLRNQLKANREKVKDLKVIEKILRTLTPRFNYIVIAIKELKD